MTIPRNLSILARGADSSGVLGVTNGGTGATTLTANNVLLGNGTSALQSVAPGSSGNVLTSNGTTWTSSAPVVGSLTLLTTLTTTSGTTQVANNFPSTYTAIYVVVNNISNSTGGDAVYLEVSSNNGSTWGTPKAIQQGASTNYYGIFFIGQTNLSVTNHTISTGTSANLNTTGYVSTPSAGIINALRFSWSSGYTFNGGTIQVYGWN